MGRNFEHCKFTTFYAITSENKSLSNKLNSTKNLAHENFGYQNQCLSKIYVCTPISTLFYNHVEAYDSIQTYGGCKNVVFSNEAAVKFKFLPYPLFSKVSSQFYRVLCHFCSKYIEIE